jgi:hypothetical protein
LDEELQHEVEGLIRSGHSTRAEEWRDPEPSGEDQPDVDWAPEDTLTGGTPPGMTPADVAGRAELAAALDRRAFPADRDALVAVAEENNAPEPVLSQLRRLPNGQRFDNVNALWVALGHGVEQHRF